MQMTEVVRNFLDMGGSLAPSQFKQFWASLGSSLDNTTCYLTVLLVKLVGLEVNAERTANLTDLIKVTHAHFQSLCVGRFRVGVGPTSDHVYCHTHAHSLTHSPPPLAAIARALVLFHLVLPTTIMAALC